MTPSMSERAAFASLEAAVYGAVAVLGLRRTAGIINRLALNLYEEGGYTEPAPEVIVTLEISANTIHDDRPNRPARLTCSDV